MKVYQQNITNIFQYNTFLCYSFSTQKRKEKPKSATAWLGSGVVGVGRGGSRTVVRLSSGSMGSASQWSAVVASAIFRAAPSPRNPPVDTTLAQSSSPPPPLSDALPMSPHHLVRAGASGPVEVIVKANGECGIHSTSAREMVKVRSWRRQVFFFFFFGLIRVFVGIYSETGAKIWKYEFFLNYWGLFEIFVMTNILKK